MSRTRTTKSAAARVDPRYVRKKRALRRVTYLSALIVSLVAFGWWGIKEVRGDKTLESPGHLAGVHGLWENDCAKCHKPEQDAAGRPKEHGSLSRAVYDDACLTCHDGPIHHENQKTLVPVSRSAPDRSAERRRTCSACHTEHRGTEALLARGDEKCVQCHSDLSPDKVNHPPLVKPKVDHFWLVSDTPRRGAHPPFGRSLSLPAAGPAPVAGAAPARPYAPNPRLVDPTPLKYNHATHIKVSPETADCATCHRLTTPEATGTQRPDRRYMQPVNYQSNCAKCHGIEFIKGSGITVPHQSLDAIRPLLAPYADLEAGFLRQINEMPKEQRDKELGGGGGGPRIPGQKKKEAKKPEVWAKEKADEVRRKVMALFTKGYTPPGMGPASEAVLKANAEYQAQLDAGNPTPPPLQVPDALTALMNASGFPENFLGHDQQTGCSKCHVMSDASPPGAKHGTAGDLLMKLAGPPMAPSVVASFRSGGSGAAAAPSTQPYMLPTGLTHAPRRWFVNSTFDHDAHRMMGCAECHRGVSGDNASAVGTTAAVEVPAENDPDAPDPMLRQFGQTTGRVLMPTLADCVNCHREPTADEPGAGAACQSCHVFHDRSRETGGGMNTLATLSGRAPTSQPSPAP